MLVVVSIQMILVISFVILLCMIQAKLSRHKNKFRGLMLPGIFFCVSIIVVLMFSGISQDKYIIETRNGDTYIYHSQEECEAKGDELFKSEIDFAASSVVRYKADFADLIKYFIVMNLFTVVFLFIYISSRRYVEDKEVM